MTRSDDYRRSGKTCVDLAEKARSPADRAHWLMLAQGWFKLADDEERALARWTEEENPKPDERGRRGYA
jgi:hypothetical protein